MRADIVSNPQAGNHDYGWRQAFGNGLARHGWQVRQVQDFQPGADLFVIWGVRRQDMIQRARHHGAVVCVLERGYLGDRMSYTSVSFGGQLNGRAEFRISPDAFDRDRWRSMIPDPKPWDDWDDGRTLVMGQVPGDQSIKGVDFCRWVKDVRASLEKVGRLVDFRPHPQDSRYSTRRRRTLEEDLADTNLVVTYNSNSAVDAVLAGVPTISQDRGSMAWDVSSHLVPHRITPDRSDWLARLAWKQYSKDEMESGFCAEAVVLHDWRRTDWQAAGGSLPAGEHHQRI